MRSEKDVWLEKQLEGLKRSPKKLAVVAIAAMVLGAILLRPTNNPNSEPTTPAQTPVTNHTATHIPVASARSTSLTETESLPPDDALPSEFVALFRKAASGNGTGNAMGYSYKFAVEGKQALAIFTPQPLPRDDATVIGAINDVAERAFRVNMRGGSARLAPGRYGNEIAIEGGGSATYTLLIKQETAEGVYGPGEPHTLLIRLE